MEFHHFDDFFIVNITEGARYMKEKGIVIDIRSPLQIIVTVDLNEKEAVAFVDYYKSLTDVISEVINDDILTIELEDPCFYIYKSFPPFYIKQEQE